MSKTSYRDLFFFSFIVISIKWVTSYYFFDESIISVCSSAFFGGVKPRCLQPEAETILPLDDLWIKPRCSRYGSITSSIISFCSDKIADNVSSPTHDQWNLPL